MKKGFITFLLLASFITVKAQVNETEKVKDTVKTEVVNVITKYNPKIADAKKIKKNPIIKLLKKSERKKLKYSIFSAPVASTFIPKSGVVKGIDVGVKERIYNNYLALGYGNYNAPFLETFLNYSTRFRNDFGLYIKYLSALDNVNNSVLNSNYSNLITSFYYKQEDRYFDWKVIVNAEQNKYNWYGLPILNFTQPTINVINEEQNYNYFKLTGEFNFIDSYIEFANISTSYLTDNYGSREILANFDAKLDFPLDFLFSGLNDISVKTSIEYLTGKFNNSYLDYSQIDYSILTFYINPKYKIAYKGFSLDAGFKIITSLDTENSSTNIFVLPDFKIQRQIIKNYLSFYGGFKGDLITNTFKSFTEVNPYASPSLFITQTAEKSNIFLGFNGKINNNLSFNLMGTMKNEEDKPLFLRNNSKSDGTFNVKNGNPLLGYEYGNSFGVYYDDVKTTSIFAEIEYDYNKNITLGTDIQFDNYTVNKALTHWNLPNLQASIFGKYKSNKWYATTNIFYVGDRKDVLYNIPFPSGIKGFQSLNSFIDVNLNGGYHFNDKFSAFLKLNNVLNTNYQRFANFDTQGFQIIGGITYKFDF